ncbi:MAG TPA: putative DNA-binding domain-containing protein [Methylocystis sp.]|nr:putative DNA-binding domain-containing protein [Methylocystis sp.]
MADELRPFQRLRQAFAAAIRDPQGHAGPDAAPQERLQIYRQLAFNNVESFLATGFPVVKAVLGDARPALICDFLRRRRCQTPYLFELGEEFLAYLQDERGLNKDDPPFLIELAHYEWVELALLIDEASPPEENPELVEEPLAHTICLSELASPLAYRFPVHRVSPDFLPAAPPAEPTFLLVYRDRSDEVNFLEIGAGAYRLLDALQQAGPIEAGVILSKTASASDLDRETLRRNHQELLSELAKLSVIGARAATEREIALAPNAELEPPR